jgi:hypothetical protein
VLELELHVDLDCVTPKSNIVRWIGFVSEGELKAKLPGVELDGAFYIARAYDWVCLYEHKGSGLTMHITGAATATSDT